MQVATFWESEAQGKAEMSFYIKLMLTLEATYLHVPEFIPELRGVHILVWRILVRYFVINKLKHFRSPSDISGYKTVIILITVKRNCHIDKWFAA